MTISKRKEKTSYNWSQR